MTQPKSSDQWPRWAVLDPGPADEVEHILRRFDSIQAVAQEFAHSGITFYESPEQAEHEARRRVFILRARAGIVKAAHEAGIAHDQPETMLEEIGIGHAGYTGSQEVGADAAAAMSVLTGMLDESTAEEQRVLRLAISILRGEAERQEEMVTTAVRHLRWAISHGDDAEETLGWLLLRMHMPFYVAREVERRLLAEIRAMQPREV